MLASSGVAQFGSGMLADPAGQAAVAAWAVAVSERIDAWYIAFDLDALDASGAWAVAMPEPDGLSLDDAVRSIRAIVTSGAPVIGFGATAAMPREGGDMDATTGAVVALTEAALGRA
jgi:arginase family enzyme